MAMALTSFVQPMLKNTQSTSSVSIQIKYEEDGPLSVRPSPSPSPSASHSIPMNNLASPSSQDTMTPVVELSLDLGIIESENNDKSSKPSHDTNAETKCQHQCQHDHDCDTSDTNEETSVSESTCRYCYSSTPRSENVSQCPCSGVLCRECLIRELKLTHGRNKSVLQCTVCKTPYEVQTEFDFDFSRDCRSFCGKFLIHCGLKDEQYLLDSVGGKIGFLLVILGINTWILSTSLLFAFPPNGCPIELYYMVSVFDFAVGISTIWFIIKCRYLSPLFLSVMYFMRFMYILLGWIPAVNLCNIYKYHQAESNHVSILAYFLVFSFISSVIMCVCWTLDFKSQYSKYSKENGKLILSKNNIKIEIDNFVRAHEQDQF